MNENKNLFHLMGDWWETTKSRSVQPRETHWKQQWIPTPGNLLVSVSLIFVLLWAQSVDAVPFYAGNAASTGTIAYQGRLADSSGTPLTSTLNMTFRLYAAATGGTPLWEEQWNGPNSVQVSDGLFNVMLGSLTPIPQSVISGNSNLFLGITVGTDSEMSPRVQLGSVLFAVQALTVPDGSITAAKLAADVSLAPTTGSITTTMIADGAVTTAKATGFVTAIGSNLLIQSGTRTPVTGTSTVIVFPKPFSVRPTVIAVADTIGGQNVTVSYTTTDQFRVDIPDTGGNIAINWIAVGVR
jgi:hypothetical protein